MRGGVKVMSRVKSGRGENKYRRREECIIEGSVKCIWWGRSEDDWSKRGEEVSLKRIEYV